jgi:hypothetical protein
LAQRSSAKLGIVTKIGKRCKRIGNSSQDRVVFLEAFSVGCLSYNAAASLTF